MFLLFLFVRKFVYQAGGHEQITSEQESRSKEGTKEAFIGFETVDLIGQGEEL